MEATGVYWKPVYYILEEDFECWLLNARHLKNVPGRKTDVKDAEWICQLLEYGLVRPSFQLLAAKEIRELEGTSPATARGRYKSAPRRSSVLRRCSRRPGSSSPRSQRGCWELRGGRASRRSLAVHRPEGFGGVGQWASAREDPGARRGPRREPFFSPRLHGRECIGPHRLPGRVHSAP